MAPPLNNNTQPPSSLSASPVERTSSDSTKIPPPKKIFPKTAQPLPVDPQPIKQPGQNPPLPTVPPLNTLPKQAPPSSTQPPSTVKPKPLPETVNEPAQKKIAPKKNTEKKVTSEKKPIQLAVDGKEVESAEEAKLPPGHYEIRTMHQDLQRLRKGGPVRPSAISMEAVKTPLPPKKETFLDNNKPSRKSPPSIVIDTPSGFLSRISSKVLYGTGIAIILAVVAAGAWYVFLRTTSDTEAPPPPPPPTQQTPPPPPPTTQLQSFLSAIYPGSAPTHITNSSETITSATSLSLVDSLLSLRNQPTAEDNITHIDLRSAASAQDVLTLTDISMPQEIIDVLSDSNPLSPMLIGITTNEELRFGLIIPLPNKEILPTLRSELRAWEWRLDEDVSLLFTGTEKGTPSSQTFLDNRYNDTDVRYRNFSGADVTIDYAIITSNSEELFLAISTSRDSLFLLIDTLTEKE